MGLGADGERACRGGIEKIVLRADGASRGNPGHAGIGIVLLDGEGRTIREHCKYIGRTTNNVAEYRAAIVGLKLARELGAREVTILSDSELMVNQLTGRYRVKSKRLQPLFREVQAVLAEFRVFHVRHVPREENSRADKLANQGIDEHV